MARNKKIGGFDLGTDVNLLVLGGGALVIYLVVKNSGLLGGGSTSASGNTSPTAAVSDTATYQAQGQTPKFSDATYANMADTIFQAGNTAFPFAADSAAALSIFDQLDDPIDVSKLITAFGTRTVQLFWTMDFPTFISKGFTSSAVASFNQQLQWNGITNYQF